MHTAIRRIAVISSQAFSIANFRGPLIQALVARGVEVFALAPDYDAATRQRVERLGARPVDISLERAGTRLARDLRDVWRLARVLRTLQPDATLAYFVKPVVYGSIAARLAGVPQRFSMIEGLGYVFAADAMAGGWRRRLLRRAVSRLYAVALALNDKVFFLNAEDLAQFETERLVPPGRAVRLDGIGVDLGHFALAPPHEQPVTFLLAARLLADKGIREYVAAAREVRTRHPQARFILAGGVDPNPGSLTRSEVEGWVREGALEWTGHVDDIRPVLRRASVFVLPSYYREGLPRSSQEAMAMGRPVITTDTPGCRETVAEGRNGYLVPARDSAALARAMLRFVEDPSLIERLGRESRRIAEQRFDVHRTNARILGAMGL